MEVKHFHYSFTQKYLCEIQKVFCGAFRFVLTSSNHLNAY